MKHKNLWKKVKKSIVIFTNFSRYLKKKKEVK